VMQYFLRSYVVRYEPYYSSIPAGRLDPNALMHSANSKAASLLILLMVASGATATPTVEARYVTSGLTEACRISLFDTIEKDVLQSREVLILHSALLFTCLAAWSGDKWHMDVSFPASTSLHRRTYSPLVTDGHGTTGNVFGGKCFPLFVWISPARLTRRRCSPMPACWKPRI